MGHIKTRLILKNLDDIKQAEKGKLPEREIRQAEVEVMVDTGATTLIINEELFERLGLDARSEREITFANDAQEICKLTDPVEIHWENRSIAMPALVVKEASEMLLGVLPLEGMDLMVDPVRQKLIGAHGDQVVYLAKKRALQTPL
ncbi:MAG: retroviral-like aspartic protease family protein [Spirochaetaceae bacterium]|jgi:clan AA aspartic protease|nr:retroviral-like aspartic protease family protein [Spirochaetaceae bacterium]